MIINKNNYEEYVVSSLEGLLTTEEQAKLDAFLHEHPELKQEADAYKFTFIIPDKTIGYPHKELLLKPEPIERTFTPFYKRYSIWLSVAAAVLVLIVFRIFLHTDNITSPQIITPTELSQPIKQSTHTVNYSLAGQQLQGAFGSSKGNLSVINTVNNQFNSSNVASKQKTVAMVKEVSDIPAKNAAYIPQQQNRRFATLNTNSSEQARFVAERLIAQRNQSALISNAALVGKTLLHLSGRELPSEINNQAGQQFRVVTVDYNSKDFSFVKIVR